MTNTATVTHQCDNGHDVVLPATVISGNAQCGITGCDDPWVDISHGYRHIGWCTMCGGIDSEHTDDCGSVLVPTIACEECGAPSGARCAPMCTSDEATRYDDILP